jgi:hypothetical protein
MGLMTASKNYGHRSGQRTDNANKAAPKRISGGKEHHLGGMT